MSDTVHSIIFDELMFATRTSLIQESAVPEGGKQAGLKTLGLLAGLTLHYYADALVGAGRQFGKKGSALFSLLLLSPPIFLLTSLPK